MKSRASQQLDAALVALGAAFNIMCVENDAMWEDQSIPEEERERRNGPIDRLVQRIASTPAHSMAGVEVKARVLSWIWVDTKGDDEPENVADRLTMQVVRGVRDHAPLPWRAP